MSIKDIAIENKKNRIYEDFNEIMDEVRKCQKRLNNVENYLLELENKLDNEL